MSNAIERILGTVYDNRMDRMRQRGPVTIRPPFSWPGGKHKMLKYLMPLIPKSKVFIEVFGGSGTVSINHRGSSLSVYNDRYSGVVAFYNCLRDKEKMEKMVELLELMPHSCEQFDQCKKDAVFSLKTAMHDPNRAAAWYYTICCSFGALGRNWGYEKKKSSVVEKFRNKLKFFPQIHQVFANIQVDNLDWEKCLHKYDRADAVFYLDPPYLNVSGGIYRNTLSSKDHKRMLDTVFSLKAQVVMSHYDHVLYRGYDWKETHEFDKCVSVKNIEFGDRTRVKEIVWIK